MKKVFAKEKANDVYFELNDNTDTKFYDNSVSVYLGSAGDLDSTEKPKRYVAKLKDDTVLDGFAFLNENKEDIIQYGIDSGLVEMNRYYLVNFSQDDEVFTDEFQDLRDALSATSEFQDPRDALIATGEFQDPRDALIATGTLSPRDLNNTEKVERLLKDIDFEAYGIEVVDRAILISNPNRAFDLALIDIVNHWAKENELNGVVWDRGNSLSGVVFSGKSNHVMINVKEHKAPFNYPLPSPLDSSSVESHRKTAYLEDGVMKISDEVINELTRPIRKAK